MQWQANGELAEGVLSGLAVHFLTVEQRHHNQDLLRLSSQAKSSD